MVLGKPVRTAAFVRLVEPAKTYKSSTAAEIRADNARMRRKANRAIDKLFDSPYTSEALEQRKRKVIKESGYTPTDRSAYKFKGDRNATRQELIEQNKELSRFLNSKTRTVEGIRSEINSLRIHPTIGKILKGAGDVEASDLIGELFGLADDIMEFLDQTGHTLDSVNTKYEAIELLMDTISVGDFEVDLTNLNPQTRKMYMEKFVNEQRTKLEEFKDDYRRHVRALGAWMND